ncbi:diguanylate cyclase [Niallia sp. NCCP-28]|uniref:diguanylate cyclase n=1 Tax=Niallia sp. NCCP-28 TaxID=2934712 RepID=UPI0020883F29|nr:diguanylate cyclase [Niallia sp. NCCP-28]GKU83592.1 GGDEF domain-containing protein [Niallia sp. NCCP-28]
MIRDLFIHICIMLASCFLGGMFFKNPHIIERFKERVLLGLLTGIFGVILMQFSIQIDENVIIDLRQIAIIVAAIYGGFLSSVCSSLVISVGRFLIGYNFNISSVLVVTIIIGILMGIISKLRITRKRKWLIMVMLSTFIFSLLLYSRVNHLPHYPHIIVLNWFFSLIGGFIAYQSVEYIRKSAYLSYEHKRQASTDFLTGLKNPREFDSLLSETLAHSNSKSRNLSLLYLDVDYFKQINDTYGHPAGDFVLKELAKILKESVRGNDLIFRNGGEEFAVLLLDTSTLQSNYIAERIRKKVEGHKFILGQEIIIKVTISVGVVTKTESAITPTELIKWADRALYIAKNRGRNQIYSISNYSNEKFITH